MLKKKELTDRIFEAVREECAKQNISGGAIGVCYVPVPGFAIDWMDSPDTCIEELYIAPIIKGDDGLCFDEDGRIVGDGSGIVAMTIAAAKRNMLAFEAMDVNPTLEQCTSGSLPDSMVIVGTANWKGAIAIEVGALTGGFCPNAGTKALSIYVGVAGGDWDQNEAAAWAALSVVEDSIQDDPHTMLARRYYN